MLLDRIERRQFKRLRLQGIGVRRRTFLARNHNCQLQYPCCRLVGVHHLPQRLTKLLNAGEPVVSAYGHGSKDGLGYHLGKWRELTHRPERIGFPRVYARHALKSRRRDRTGQKSVENGTEGINIRTATRLLAELFRRAEVDQALLNSGIQFPDATERSEERR